MAEQSTDATDTEQPQGQPEAGTQDVTDTDDDKGADYWKGRARQWEANAKKNAEAARQWEAYQESHKTEEQKAADERAALEADRDAARREARMATAALKHGLTADDLSLIDPTGTDEEFEARAAALADRLSAVNAPARHRDPNLGREHISTPAGTDWLRQSLTGS